MESIYITAILKPNEGQEAQVLAALKKVQAPSRLEEGCIKYDLYQTEDSLFILQEAWKDADALERHTQSTHYQDYREETADLVQIREVYKLKLVE